MAGIALDLFAQAADIHIDRSRGDERGFLPYGIQKLVARQDAAAVRGELFEQTELTDSSEDVAAIDLHCHG